MENILAFLKKLKHNNRKEWMDDNRQWYHQCRDEFKLLVTDLIQEVNQFDPSVGELELKNALYRINRNNRFQRDLPPYKEYFSASVSRGGKKSKFAEYYVHISPDNQSAVGGGLWHPDPKDLAQIRQEIDYNPDPILKFLKSKVIQKNFGGELHDFGRLKTAPKGYPKDHPNIELLRNKHFSVYCTMEDAAVCEKDFAKQVGKLFKQLKPLVLYLNEAVV